ncbi:flagellar filament capping protein FliD [Methylomonas rapida]|uniref:Flagellar hook-associated protein 2 n=1 Tax=Methylomonas rapida TaxID=2963939 RepID=A0ABY7GLR1_9GAMM|nr:flagellar filament capping protein FliD [Methylomonas rapida]WAR45414.1 flagellar filament capping protein FliD [Methylomonas rapida]
MSIVSTTGLGSGIDISSLVTQLVKAEGQPALNAIQRQQDAANARLSGLGTLKSALSDFQAIVTKLKDGSFFKTHKSTSSDESVLKVTAGAGSVAGSYGIEVVQLAKSQKSITTAEFANSAEVVGTGSLTFSSGSGASFNVTVDASNNSLASLRDAINSTAGNTFATASIVNVDSTENPGTTISKLVLTAKNTGIANAFTVTGTDDDGLDDGAGLSRLFTTQLSAQTAASDAVIKVDGQTATRSTNSITDVIQGLTLDLQSAKVGAVINANVSLDNEAINKTISDFVTAYNKLHTVTKDLGKYGGSANGAGNGALLGDATLRYVTSQVRQDASNTVSSVTGNYNSLAMIGVKIDKDGVMSLDSTQLNKALSADLQSVGNVFSSSDGVATRLYAKVANFLQSGGPLDSQQTSLQKRLSDLEDRKADVQIRLDNLQKSLQKQFSAMDSAVGQFNATGNFLSNWISNLK